MVLAHGLRFMVLIEFDKVVEVLERLDDASKVYITILGTKPRVAVAVGEKYFVRIGQYISAVVIAVERDSSTEVRVVAHSGLRLGAVGDYGASRSYTEDIMVKLCEALNVKPSDVAHVDYLERSKSSLLNSGVS